MSHAKREVGAACALLLVQRRSRDNRPVGRSVERVSVEEHMPDHRAAVLSPERSPPPHCPSMEEHS